MKEIEEDMEEIDGNMKEIEEDMEAIEEDVKEIEENMNQLEEDLKELKEDISDDDVFLNWKRKPIIAKKNKRRIIDEEENESNPPNISNPNQKKRKVHQKFEESIEGTKIEKQEKKN